RQRPAGPGPRTPYDDRGARAPRHRSSWLHHVEEARAFQRSATASVSGARLGRRTSLRSQSSAGALEIGGEQRLQAGQIAGAGGHREGPQETTVGGRAERMSPVASDTRAGALHELPRVGRAELKGLRDLPVRVLEALS